ncbi:MAG: DUF5928 domain-containing protein [Pseudomonadota bacterium]
MARIAFLLMAHKDAASVISQAEALIARGDYVAIHFDKRASPESYGAITKALGANPSVTFARRVKCGWGEYSLVQATLNLIRAARRTFKDITHYYLISGDCLPTKSRDYMDRFLEDGCDHIEIADFLTSDWIRTGMKEDRLVYRHWLNERKYKWLFYASLNLQRRLKLSRPLPEGLRVRIGSQWWVLRADTINKVLAFLAKRRDVCRFFRTTWIPDETFFQTLVYHLVPREEIRSAPPTHFIFTDYGIPVVFQRDHLSYLKGRETLFARKVTGHAPELREALLEGFVAPETEYIAPVQSGNALYPYLARRGRSGSRYAPRFWDQAIRSRSATEVLIIAAKVWHIGVGIQGEVAKATGMHGLGYVFDEDKPIGISLGNLEHGIAKRATHRHALMNVIFDRIEDDRMILCVDTSRTDIMSDIVARNGDVRILLVERPVPEDQIVERAERAGLIGASSGDFERREAIKTLQHEFNSAGGELRNHFSGRVFVNQLDRSSEANIRDMARFLRMPREVAETVARGAETYVD